ncbi:hypothetical protein AQUCO_00600194v1 [Aquilegia coerulea]|uniref:DNA-(apurinic or apyrimidinic site) endonuclease 2 n=1 Tax=Aquilegia coerulea TaxID=218851 RepID=A0A2G5ENZ5_AQUCA|nr:hypothetical protein AQUCO_00600194v1 [Aquilegia coerulea]
MKIVTYNVNGLRPRIAQHGGSLLKLLNSLEADIICFQETKLSREEVTADLIMAEGYESFFSCTYTSGRGRLGYSGVATFCRVNSAFSSNEVALPVVAEEGFTGLLEHCRVVNSIKKDFLIGVSSKVDGLEGFTNEDLLKVDCEGRCIITDHGHFVLFNIYGPRAECDDTERIEFKLTFFKILQKRWESYFRQGKRVVVVGDLNIAPYAIDRCEAGPDFEKNQFRKWLRSLLVDHGGPFVDVFRIKHPQRKDAYTCWSVASGAEEFNFGSRIDHILVAGPCLHQSDNMDGHNFVACHISACDIMTQYKRWKPDNIPRQKGGRNIKLEGSDHAPVYVSLQDIPDLSEHNTPSLAARYVPKVRGVQQTIVSLLSKRQVNAQVKGQSVSQLCDENIKKGSCDDNDERISQEGCISDSSSAPNHSAIQESQHANSSVVANAAVSGNIVVMSKSERRKLIPLGCTKSNKKARHSNSIQRTLGSYFQKKPSPDVDGDCYSSEMSLSQADIGSRETESSVLIQELNSSEELLVHPRNSFPNNEINVSPSTKDQKDANAWTTENDKHNVALFEWNRIQQLMSKRKSVPLCIGHGEPCVARVVKKEGPNLGRKFYVCRRAEGPSSNPEARCNYFKWETSEAGQKR